MSDISPSQAPTGAGGGKASDWIKSHKWAVAGGGVVLLIGVIYFLKQRSAANAAAAANTSSTTNAAGTADQGELFELPTSDFASGQSDQGLTNTATSSPPVNTTVTVTGTTPTGGAGTSGSTNDNAATANAYPVGTRVTADESIVQALYDPPEKGWIDLTNKLGLYGSGTNVSGSAYNPNATGTGRIQLADNGAEVEEFNSAGKLAGTYKVT